MLYINNIIVYYIYFQSRLESGIAEELQLQNPEFIKCITGAISHAVELHVELILARD